MNKMIKLPLFLGVVGGLCGSLLAVTYFITQPRIEAAEKERIAAAYRVHFADIKESVDKTVSADLASAGVSAKVDALDASQNVIGTIYTATVKGYGGDVTFTVSFANDQVRKFVTIASGESAQGKDFMTAIEGASDFAVDKVVDYKSGSSVTYGAVSKCINVCYADFAGK